MSPKTCIKEPLVTDKIDPLFFIKCKKSILITRDGLVSIKDSALNFRISVSFSNKNRKNRLNNGIAQQSEI